MSLYRFLLKIPLIAYGIVFLFLAVIANLSFPFLGMEVTSASYLNNLLIRFFFEFAELLNIDLSLIFKATGLLIICILIFLNIKIIKLKFYDLNLHAPIIAFLFTGPILFSLIVDINFLVSGLFTLSTFYFQIKYLDDLKRNDLIFLIIFSVLAFSNGNYYFLIIITILASIKIFNFKINKEDKIKILSNLTILYLLFFIFLIINSINQSLNIMNINFNFEIFIQKVFIILLLFLPLMGLLINALLFNIFKRVNWNKDLILFLIVGITSLVIYLFSSSKDMSPLIFGSSIITIYIFRTLEFVELKWTKVFFLTLVILPVAVIILDNTLYQSKEEIPVLNYIIYAGLVIIGLINPFFYFQKQTSIEILKISLFSISLNALLVFSFILLQYKNYFIAEVIQSSIEKDFDCSFETTKLTMENIDPNIISNYLINNTKLVNNYTCELLIKFNSLDNMPIENQESINKTALDIQTRKFININLSKI